MKIGSQITKLSGFTHIIYATGVKPQNHLYDEIKEEVEVYFIGDASQPAQALEAVRSAYELSMTL